MNPILNALNQQPEKQTPRVDQVRDLYQAYRSSSNPAQFLNNIAQQNPIIAQIARNGNLQQTFYSMCQQRGINPQDIINGIQR